jgi:transcription antitermination protein NusB
MPDSDTIDITANTAALDFSENEQPMLEESDDHTNSGIDPRHARRIGLMQQLFAYTFLETPELQAQFTTEHPDMAELIKNLPELDAELKEHAPERPLSEINKVDLAILRLVVFEWKQSRTPQKVLINEGVELAKEFGTESSPKFVNGVLAHLLKPENQE